jgi:hypothetical protein
MFAAFGRLSFLISFGISIVCLNKFRASFFEVALGSEPGPIRGKRMVRFVLRAKGVFLMSG